MMEYENYFEKTLNFISIYQELIDCHLVDFITEKLWNKCLPEKLKSELESIDTTDIWMENNTRPELSNFIQLTRSLSLESCPAVICVDDLLKLLPQFPSKEQSIKNKFIESKSKFMNTKKSYEIDVLGKIIAEMALSTHSLVIDAGAGKGYLSTYLSEHFDVPVLAIDSSHTCHKGAINRQEKIQKRKQSLTKIRYVIQELDETTDYNKIVNTNYPDWSVNRNLILTGLHTCGMLVHSVMKAFLHAKDIHLLFIVPCCYHLTDESLSGRWIFSKNARMLAQQSIERSRHNKYFTPSLFYRAVLQVILHSMGYYNTKVGSGGPLDNFADYAKWALSKIGVDNKQVFITSKIPSTRALQKIYQSHIHFESKLHLFQTLRIYTSSVVEAAIMLDRIIFLQNNAQHSKIAIVRLFDPTVSPRCYGIFMIK